MEELKKDLQKRTIGGLELEAVRVSVPIPHWQLKLPNGSIVSDVFDGSSRPKLWASVEYMHNRLGTDRFVSGFRL